MTRLSFKTIGLLALPLIASASIQAQTVTDPVGVVKITIAAAAAADNPTYSFLSTSMSQEVAYQGVVDSGGTGTITIGSDDWTVNQFNGVPHYAIVASGTREGEILDIASNTVNTLTLSGGPASEDQSGLAGETIRIHKHNTIASIFGTNHNPSSGTVQAGNRDTADQIQLYNPIQKKFETYYFNTEQYVGPIPGRTYHIGWVRSDARENDASNIPIYPDDGFIYKRVNHVSGFSLSVSGNVITNNIKVPVINGYNLITIPYPVDKSITLATSGLRPENDVDFDVNKHLIAGSRSTADQVILYNAVSKQYETYYYNNEPYVGPIPGRTYHQGWVNSSARENDAASTVIPAGRAIFILRREGSPAFNWEFNNVTQ
ncbi:MAG: TIGR02597 family protein [Verrucomicrobiae bacterium]|nr:TIGR02597 family protein [Verrucomicrobiae bacterium]NNJ85622.1 TIGR02597 family protein [Akkermansiaceae bacterium]